MSSREFNNAARNQLELPPGLMVPIWLTTIVLLLATLGFWTWILCVFAALSFWSWRRYALALRMYRLSIDQRPPVHRSMSVRIAEGVVYTLATMVWTLMLGFVLYVDSPLRAEQDVLDHHQAFKMLWNGDRPFIYMSYFVDGNTEHANECFVYYHPQNKSYFIRKQRIYFRFDTQGGGTGAWDPRIIAELDTLRSAPAFPARLPGPWATLPGRLLIVSQRSGGVCRTRYYDRGFLPRQIELALDATRDYRPSNADSMGWAPAEWPPPPL